MTPDRLNELGLTILHHQALSTEEAADLWQALVGQRPRTPQRCHFCNGEGYKASSVAANLDAQKMPCGCCKATGYKDCWTWKKAEQAVRDAVEATRLDVHRLHVDQDAPSVSVRITRVPVEPMAVSELANHEAQHMSHVAADFVEDWLVNHVAIQSDPERCKLALAAVSSLNALYQLIGRQAAK